MNRSIYRTTFVTMALALLGAMGAVSVHADDVIYTGPNNGDWTTGANWSTTTYPTANDNARLGIGTDNLTANLTSVAPNNILAIRLGVDAGSSGTINVNAGGSMEATASSSWDSHIGASGAGTVNVNGGFINLNYAEVGRNNGSTGTINLNSGELRIARGSGETSIYFGSNDNDSPGGTGIVNIYGGTFITRAGVELGNQDDAADAGTGSFNVFGSDAAIGIGSHSSIDGNWYQGPGYTLSVGVDLGGVSKILIDDYDNDGGCDATFAAGSLLDVDYYDDGYAGGTWTVLEVEGTNIVDHGLAFAPGVDTNIWSFAIDNSGANGKLILTAAGDPPPPPPDVTLTVGDTRRQMMRYGLDYERLWFWYGSGLDPVPQWSVNDCNIDYIRTAMNSGYELTENVFDLSEYTDKIIPMMTAMQEANPHIKWFASPRPLNEAVSGAAWQPYPLWVTGATNYTSSAFDFNDLKCAEYMIKYLLLMKSYGFKITYMDVTNEWQSDFFGGRVTQSDVRDIAQAFQDYLAAPWSHPDYPGLVLTEEDFPLLVAPSAWNYQQGGNWIDSLNTQAKKDAVDIAACHNTDKTGTAQGFADDVGEFCNPGTEIWETEQHGWKSTSGANEVTTFSFYMESIRAGFTGINGWLAIGTTSQGHCYLLNNGSTVTRNVKYYIFKKLSNTSNYGYALDIDEPAQLNNTMALVRENLLTVWVNNTSVGSVLTEIDFSDYVRDASDITYTRWHESLPVEGVEDTATWSSPSTVMVDIASESLYCIEIPLVDPERNFPFVQAENYTTGSGVSVLPCSDTGGGDMVAFWSTSDEISFDLDITKTYPHDVAFRVSSEFEDIRFDIYNGANLLASVDRMATGGAQNWTTIYKTLALDGGPMDLRIVATGRGGWNLNWIRFDQQFFGNTATPDNLALNQPASASSVHSPGYEADKAVDGDTATRWASAVATPWLEIYLGTPTLVNSARFLDYGDRIKGYEIQYFTSRTWHTAFIGGDPDDDQVDVFPEVTGTRFRLLVTSSINSPSIWEFELYYDPSVAGGGPATAIDVASNAAWLSWEGVPGLTYALQRTTDLATNNYTTLESGIPGQPDGHTNAVAIPDDTAFYRVILE